MASKDIVKTVEGFLVPILTENNFELYDLEFVKEGANWYLRIFIDRPGGVTIDDCELVSRSIEAILDKNDPIPQAYFLEVSSPGIDRALKKEADYERYAGQLVDIKLYKAIGSRKEYQGTLRGLVDGMVTIEDEDGEMRRFKREELVFCRLAVIL